MKNIRSKILLLLSVSFSTFFILSFMSIDSFIELKSHLDVLDGSRNVSESFLSYIAEDIKAKPATTQIRAVVSEFKANSRNRKLLIENTLESMGHSNFNEQYKLYKANEDLFITYINKQSKYYTRKFEFLTFLLILNITATFTALIFMLNSMIFKPLRLSTQNMIDFIHGKYSYQYKVPANNEIGQLQTSFNLMAQKVISQMEELKRLDQAKSDFLSIASHELRTPLTSIKGSLSLLQSDVTEDFNESTLKLMGIATTETDRLIRLINDLLDLAKIESGKLPLTLQWNKLSDIIKNTQQGLIGLAEKANVNIKYFSEDEIDIYCDPDRIQQVLTNFLSNAIKHSPAESDIIINLDFTLENEAIVSVIDSGKGISPDDQELLFKKFRQITGPENPLVKGTGLGLSIAKALIEEHGGEVGVKSSPSMGSTFYFVLPTWRNSTTQVERAA